MKVKKSDWIISLAILLVAGFGILSMLKETFRFPAKNEPNREAQLQLRESISIGSTYEEVLKAYWKCRTHELRINVRTPDLWTVSMPPEFAATDWVLLIEFSEEQVKAIRIKNADGVKPIESPADIGAETQDGPQEVPTARQ